MDDSSNAVAPAAFRKAAEVLAAAMGLDAERAIAGECIDCDGFRIWLKHHGEDDPSGLTLLVGIGEVPPDFGPRMLSAFALLELNVIRPAKTKGWYGVLPELGQFVQCRRIALDEVDEGITALAEAIKAAKSAWDQAAHADSHVRAQASHDAPFENARH
jgi:hypothetical protein